MNALYFKRCVSEGQILKQWKHSSTEYIGTIGNWKQHFITFEKSISELCINYDRRCATFSKITCAQKTSFFFENLGCLLSNYSDHKTVTCAGILIAIGTINSQNHSI